uniref:Uncharacterized protein n=1 Tax=Pongo abelii TaxID=9601 RepID=H2P3U4_PONAB
MAAHREPPHASPVIQQAAHALRVHTTSICASQHSFPWWLCSYTHQDLGLERTLLPDILYRDVAFLNLVDPISHDLLVNLARDLQCPKKDYELWKSSDKICRQLIYHLTPHSKQQQGSSLRQRKTQSWTVLPPAIHTSLNLWPVTRPGHPTPPPNSQGDLSRHLQLRLPNRLQGRQILDPSGAASRRLCWQGRLWTSQASRCRHWTCN